MASSAPTIFPHLSSTGLPPTSRQVSQTYNAFLSTQLHAGTAQPLLVPYFLYGLDLLILYLLIPHKNSPIIYAARWPVFGLICWFQWQIIQELRTLAFGTGFLVGLVAVWGIIGWSATWLIFRKPQWDAKRVVKRVVKGKSGVGNGYAKASAEKMKKAYSGETRAEVSEEYYWQSYPDTLSERVPWILDLLITFRGIGWNWAVQPLPSLPPKVIHSLGDNITRYAMNPYSLTGLRRYSTKKEFLLASLPKFIIAYILTDALRSFLPLDPYFLFGPTSYALPAALAALHPLVLRTIRTALTGFAIITALEYLMLIPILISMFLPLPGIWNESWMWPTSFGSLQNVSRRGLAGLWGGYWHQTFRFAFSAPTAYLVRKGYLQRGAMSEKVVGLLFAFGISGCMHAGGSATQLTYTKPWESFSFFMLQAVGIVLQEYLARQLSPLLRYLANSKPPTPYANVNPNLQHKSLKQAANWAFALGWLCLTGPLIANDFARGGIWLFEPVPLSFFRAMGWAEKDAGLVCWDVGNWVYSYDGGKWWLRGLAI